MEVNYIRYRPRKKKNYKAVEVIKHRINYQIKAPEVMVVSGDSEQLGVMPTEKAIALAKEQGKDLIEVAEKAVPPVCKIIDLGKYKFQERQKAKKTEGQKKTTTKQLTIGVNIGDFDLGVRLNQARRFIQDKNRVKIIVRFRGREVTHPEVGQEKIFFFAKGLEDVARSDIQGTPVLTNKTMEVTFSPK